MLLYFYIFSAEINYKNNTHNYAVIQMVKSKRNYLVDKYKLDSPNQTRFEDMDGDFYPKDIEPPDIAFVPLAEPHVLVTDLYIKSEPWYYIRELIPKLAEQAFICYYSGLYFASFLTTLNCIELTLKYEYVRQKIIKPSELTENFTFGLAIQKDKLSKINFKKYYQILSILNDARIGIIHFNYKKLKHSTLKLLLSKRPKDGYITIENFDGKTIREKYKPSEWYTVPISNSRDWSRFAFFAYDVMYKITKQLYGESKKGGYLKECLADYNKLKSLYGSGFVFKLNK